MRRLATLGRCLEGLRITTSAAHHTRYFHSTALLNAPKPAPPAAAKGGAAKPAAGKQKTKDELEDEEDERELGMLLAERQMDGVQYLKGERRVGLIGQKLGMMNLFDQWGVQRSVTVIRIDNHVLHHNETPHPKTGGLSIKVGAGERKPKKTPDWLARMCERASCDFKMRVHDFPVTEKAMVPVGTRLQARHFLPGQYIDIISTTIGRGFAGVMKRWKFSGIGASHGVSLTHRAPGSIGQTGMSKVFKGKKMPGRMGGKMRTALNSRVYRIDTERNLIFLLGSVPGPEGCWLILQDAKLKKFLKEKDVPPFPTYFVKDAASEPKTLIMAPEGSDPFAYALE